MALVSNEFTKFLKNLTVGFCEPVQAGSSTPPVQGPHGRECHGLGRKPFPPPLPRTQSSSGTKQLESGPTRWVLATVNFSQWPWRQRRGTSLQANVKHPFGAPQKELGDPGGAELPMTRR